MKAHCIPFSRVPHTTKLFLDFLSYSPSVRSFFPSSPRFMEWLKPQSQRIQYDSARRSAVAAILEKQNKSWNSPAQTFANIDRLRKGALTMVTGQQVGLFGGPMFAVYKALSVVKLAEQAMAEGVEAVPVFWLATYDHDLAEVNHISLPGQDGISHTLTASSRGVPNAPVGDVRFGEEILPLFDEASSLLGDNETVRLLREAYRPGESLGSAFARFYARLFEESGVIFLDANDAELHRLAAPVYRAAIERTEPLEAALRARGESLQNGGYHEQVKVARSSALLFTLRDGARRAIRHDPNRAGEFVLEGADFSQEISGKELLNQIERIPEAFSPNVLLRPVVQDYLLPTLAYAGGAAEIAYFAQAGVLYGQLLGRVTPIIPRLSATIVEPRVQRWLRQYSLAAADVFCDAADLKKELASRSLPEDLQAAFDSTTATVQSSLANLRVSLDKLDPTLAAASETAESKIHHQLGRLRQLASSAELRRSDVVSRHAKSLSEALYPEGNLQERVLGAAYFLARNGVDLISDLHDVLHTECQDHQIVEL